MSNHETTAAWTLAGITVRDAQCEHCGRIMARCFRIVSPEGEQLTVGRVCSRKLTGYNWSVAQAERLQGLADREAAAAATYGATWTEAMALCLAAPTPGANAPAVDAMLAMREGQWWAGESLESFLAERMVAARQAV